MLGVGDHTAEEISQERNYQRPEHGADEVVANKLTDTHACDTSAHGSDGTKYRKEAGKNECASAILLKELFSTTQGAWIHEPCLFILKETRTKYSSAPVAGKPAKKCSNGNCEHEGDNRNGTTCSKQACGKKEGIAGERDNHTKRNARLNEDDQEDTDISDGLDELQEGHVEEREIHRQSILGAMDEREFSALVESEWDAMPDKFKQHVENVALLIEDEPSQELRTLEGLSEHETLLGHYHGIPNTERGAGYGVGGTLPDTITLYRLPILEEAQELTDDHTGQFKKYVAQVVRDTLWHEVGHYMGFDEHHVREREDEGTNRFES